MKSSRKNKKTKNIYSYLAVLLLASLMMLFEKMDTSAPETQKITVMQQSETSITGGPMHVYYLDVGQGSSALVESDGHFMLIDGGDRSHSSFVVSSLQDLGVTSLDYILVSHYHADHLSGIVGALNAFDCKTVICPDYETDTKLFSSFLTALEEKEIPMLYPSIGDRFSLGSASFTVIGPVSYHYEDENNNSIGIRLVHGEDSFLFTGDAEAESEEDFCKESNFLSCDVYAAGHHGSASSTTWSLLQQALPEYVVISCGKENPYGHPHEETMEKLEAIGAKVFRTDEQGTILATSSGNGIIWEPMPFHDYSND